MPTDAVILAAGRGARLQDTWDEAPKGTIELGGVGLVERSIRLLSEVGVTRVVLVTGYASGLWDDLASPIEVVRAHNDGWDRGGTMGSLATAIPRLPGDFLLLEADLLYERRAVEQLARHEDPDVLLASGTTEAGDEVWVHAPDGKLARLSKRRDALPSVEGEYVGMMRVSRALAEALVATWEQLVADYGHEWFEYDSHALMQLVPDWPVSVHVIDDLIWGEVDDRTQLRRLREVVLPQLDAAAD